MINFNVPPFVGKEEKYISEAIREYRKLCGDGNFTKKCNEWFQSKF
ncbi:dTDP-4-amino-4,6-dideoxygalactose transaminase, partial [Clostridium perfringens]|nr:dTDP-4-amino-4,6-dideoxygalactose transaminase [Clostridium perfringens]